MSSAERHHIITGLNSERFRDKAPRQVWAALLDEGVYLCSVSTMYRLLQTQGQDYRQFCRRFFEYYNHKHYHSGIGLHTPFTVHIGTAHAIQHKRVQTIEAFRATNPQRFTRRPALSGLPQAAWINESSGPGTADQQAPDQYKAV